MNRIVAPKFLTKTALAVGVTDGSPTKKMALDDKRYQKASMASKQRSTAYKYGKIVKTGAFTRFSDS